jgi:hypothetical protein
MKLNVLVWAPAGADGVLIKPGPQVVQHWRVLCYVEPLRALGVEMRGLPLVVGEPAPYAEGIEAVRAAVDWADLILWRPQSIDWLCRDCPFRTPWEALARNHAARTGHEPLPSDLPFRKFWNDLGPRRTQAAVVFDTDAWIEPDDLWWIPSALRDQVQGWRYPLGSADLVTASTPRLARYCERLNANVRVVRNSCDVSQYVPSEPRPHCKTRLVSYVWAGAFRPDDWIGPAQEAARDHRALLRTVFIGARPGEHADFREAGFDEVYGHADPGVWARTLANTWPQIGISPLKPSPVNVMRTEQKWLEFGALGVPCVAQRWRGGGPFPYDVIRDGVDGLLARGRQEWSDAIGRLARSKQLRADIGGRARERVIAEYNLADRAQEIAEAWRWAAEHAGIGRSAA